jgi:predicted nucleic acid-binding protein
MYLLDTDTLSHIQHGHPAVMARLSPPPAEEVATTIITRIEILRSRFDTIMKSATAGELERAQQWLHESDALLQSWRIVPFNNAACAVFERLRTVRGLRKIGRADLLISSIALAHRAILVTRNVRDFQLVRGLQVENWID